jgi:hypothetical protein
MEGFDINNRYDWLLAEHLVASGEAKLPLCEVAGGTPVDSGDSPVAQGKKVPPSETAGEATVDSGDSRAAQGNKVPSSR